MSGGWSPVVHLWSHCGGKLVWDDAQAMFRPDTARPPTGADGAGFVIAAGVANGHLRSAAVLADAVAAGKAAALAAGQAQDVTMAPPGRGRRGRPDRPRLDDAARGQLCAAVQDMAGFPE
jgi:hypothetical protein